MIMNDKFIEKMKKNLKTKYGHYEIYDSDELKETNRKRNENCSDEWGQYFPTELLRCGKTLYLEYLWKTAKCKKCRADLPRYPSYDNNLNEIKKCPKCGETHIFLNGIRRE